MPTRATRSIGCPKPFRISMVRSLSNDTHVTLLLCAWFGGEQKPLSTDEYNLVASWLHQNKYRPENLMDRSCDPSEVAHGAGLHPERLTALLDRGITLGFYLEEWKRRDFWILGRGDDDYPKRIRSLLGSQAPPLLFGTGNVSLLNRGGIAVMGPDQLMRAPDGQVETIVRLCVRHQRTTIASGNQRIASVAVSGGIKEKGPAIWILPGPRLSDPPGRALRKAKASEQLVMISNRSPADKRSLPHEPEIGQMLMALCDSAVYLDGTEFSMDPFSLQLAMHGALGKRNCFVWASEQVTLAAEKLIHGGAHPWTDVESALDARLLESHPEMIQQEIISDSEEKADHPESVTPEEPSQPVGDATEREVKYAEPDTGTRQDALENQDGVQLELIVPSEELSIPEEPWELTSIDENYPDELLNLVVDGDPPSLIGIGDLGLVRQGGFAIVGPTSISKNRIQQACEIAKHRKETVIVARPLKLAKKIADTLQSISQRIIWVLDEESLNKYLSGRSRQGVRAGCLVMIAPRIAIHAKDQTLLGSIVSALSSKFLYVDGAGSQNDGTRKDPSGMKDAAMKRSTESLLLHGKNISLDGQDLIDCGVMSWSDRSGTSNRREEGGKETLGIQGELF